MFDGKLRLVDKQIIFDVYHAHIVPVRLFEGASRCYSTRHPISPTASRAPSGAHTTPLRGRCET